MTTLTRQSPVAPSDCETPALASRPTYRTIARYEGGGDARAPIDLSDNTNLWGVPPSAARAIVANAATAARYPSVYSATLVEALAEHLAVPPDMIVTGSGSDDVLDAAMRALAEPGAQVALSDPTFPMAPIFARINGHVPVAVPAEGNGEVAIDGLLATGAPIIYIASPANPTGIATPPRALARLARGASGVVIIDAAYAEFADAYGAALTALAMRHERVLIVRTLSKAWGLAGLRVGYACGAPALVAEIEKARGPFKVNVLAEHAAIAALRDDWEWVVARVREAVTNREHLARRLTAMGLPPLPSEANFLLVPVLGEPGGAASLTTRLRAAGVGVRAFPALRGIGDAIRITVGPWPMMERLLDALVRVGPFAPAGR